MHGRVHLVLLLFSLLVFCLYIEWFFPSFLTTSSDRDSDKRKDIQSVLEKLRHAMKVDENNDNDGKNDTDAASSNPPQPAPQLPNQPEYLPWETLSMSHTNPYCSPPTGTPSRCCIGSSSAGGGIHWENHHDKCTSVDYYKLPMYNEQIISGALMDELAANKLTKIDNAAKQRRGRIAFTGDSMMYQFAVAFECEVLRDGKWIVASSNLEKRATPKWRFGVSAVDETKYIRTSAATTTDSDGGDDVTMRMYAQYRYNRTSWNDMHEILENNDVVVVNFGVHWLDKVEYEADMLKFFAFLKPHLKTTKVVWRETFSQHFDNEGGEYMKGKERCVNVEYGPKYPHMWRDVIVINIVKELGIDVVWLNETKAVRSQHNLYWLPTSDFSRTNWVGMHKMMKNNECEATHVCHSPFVWGRLWEGLTNAVVW